MSDTPAGKSNAYRWYVLAVLFTVYLVNFADRSILSILQQPIKDELGLSDTQLGFLTGIAFAVFYSFLGIPIARLADRGVRRNIIAIAVAVWSAMTAASGLALSFLHLLLARIGVAAGEAGGSPPSHSIISDYFSRESRATALALLAIGAPIGTMIGNLAGGWINEVWNWRSAFFVVGAPGLLLAILVRFGVREPARGAADGIVIDQEAPPMGEVLRHLWSVRSLRYTCLAAAFHVFASSGPTAWVPPMFMRSHEWNSYDIGYGLFLIGIPAAVGTLAGGFIADRLGRRDVRWYVWLPAVATGIAAPFAAYTYLAGDGVRALAVYAVPAFLRAFFLAPAFSMAQALAPQQMRAVAASLLIFVTNIMAGFGTQFVGIVSDLLGATTGLGADSLRWAMVSALTFSIVALLLYGLAARHLHGDLQDAETS